MERMDSQLLLVEDDPDILELLRIHLNDEGYALQEASDGKDAFELGQNGDIDLIVLDIMLPGMDGIELCRRLRETGVVTPILMLTAKTEESDRVIGLECGADDYMTKPFSIRELKARVKAILRRSKKPQAETEGTEKRIVDGDLVIEPEKRKVALKGERLDLTPKEYELLLTLASNPGRSFDREELLHRVWGYEYLGYEHTVNSHINRLRSKIEPDLSDPVYILTTWGIGYRFRDQDDL